MAYGREGSDEIAAKNPEQETPESATKDSQPQNSGEDISASQNSPADDASRNNKENDSAEKKNPVAKNQIANDSARQRLSGAEDGAASDINKQPEAGLYNAKNFENEAASGGVFSQFMKQQFPDRPKGGPGFLRRRGPIILIVLILGCFGGAIMGAQTMVAFSVLEQLKTRFDTISVSNSRRADRIFISQLRQNGYKSTVKSRFFGLAENKFKVTNKQRTKLAGQGMYVVDDFNGSGRSVTLFDDGSGSLKVVTADASQSSLFKNSQVDFDSVKSKLPAGYSGPTSIDTSDVMDHRTRFQTDSDYRNGTQKATRTWRRSVGAWFDSVTVKFLNNHKLTRNLFKNYINRVQDEEAGNTKSRVSAIMGQNDDTLEAGTTGGKERTTTDEEDENGNKTGRKIISTNDEDADTEDAVLTRLQLKKMDASAKRQKARQYLNEWNQKNGARAASLLSTITNLTCAALTVVAGYELLAAAKQGVQLVSFALGWSEGVQKGMVNSEEAPTATLNNALTEPLPTQREVAVGSADDDGNVDTKTVYSDDLTSALSSQGLKDLYTNDGINPNDPDVASFNVGTISQGVIGKIVGHITNATTAFITCSVAKTVAALAGAVMDGVKIAGCIMSFGIGCIIEAAADAGKALIGAELKKKIIAAATEAATPFFINLLMRDLTSNLGGKVAGEAIRSGFTKLTADNARASGQSLTDYATYLAFAAEQQRAIAEEAEYQRSTRSPFDVTSEYTFFGSLVKQLITFSTMTGAPTNVLSTIGTMTKNSAIALLPSAYADDTNTISSRLLSKEEFAKACPSLASIGAYGDAYCNPYVISDPSTMDMDPGDVVDKVAAADDNFNDDGSIKEGSDLSNYLVHCGQRSSSFGVYDNNIANSFTPDAANSTVISVIPVIGDLVEAFGNTEQVRNIDWITGQACVAGTTGTVADTGNSDYSIDAKDWSTTRYYQRYAEDQRLAESMDDDYTSAVSVFLDDYYTNHPLDNSYEGVLARNSGLTKDQVIALLDFEDYTNRIAEYDPTTRLDFTEAVDEPNLEETYDLGDPADVTPDNPLVSILRTPVVYNDLRSRSVAMG